jgi:hypothetical protein
MFTRPSCFSHITLSIVRDMANRIQNGSHDCHGPTNALGFKAKSTSWISAAQSRQSEGQSNTMGG